MRDGGGHVSRRSRQAARTVRQKLQPPKPTPSSACAHVKLPLPKPPQPPISVGMRLRRGSPATRAAASWACGGVWRGGAGDEARTGAGSRGRWWAAAVGATCAAHTCDPSCRRSAGGGGGASGRALGLATAAGAARAQAGLCPAAPPSCPVLTSSGSGMAQRRWMISKKQVGRSPTGLVKICSRMPCGGRGGRWGYEGAQQAARWPCQRQHCDPPCSLSSPLHSCTPPLPPRHPPDRPYPQAAPAPPQPCTA